VKASTRANFFICLLLILLLLGCSQEPAQENMLESMAKLDRAYIPALLFTNLQKQRESELALERLRREWDTFDGKYHNLEIRYGLNITDKFWKEDFEKINELITTAEVLVEEERLIEAHGQLEEVRIILKGLRSRNGIDYFLDRMTEFHEAMEQILLALKGKDRLYERDLIRLRAFFKKAQESWAGLGNSEIDPQLFGFEPEKVEAIGKRIKEEERVLAGFAAALSSEDADRIFQAATDLKPNFVVLYKAFGDFQPIFDQVLKERKEEEGQISVKEGEDKNETGSK
jgi:hypothetical protein